MALVGALGGRWIKVEPNDTVGHLIPSSYNRVRREVDLHVHTQQGVAVYESGRQYNNTPNAVSFDFHFFNYFRIHIYIYIF